MPLIGIGQKGNACLAKMFDSGQRNSYFCSPSIKSLTAFFNKLFKEVIMKNKLLTLAILVGLTITFSGCETPNSPENTDPGSFLAKGNPVYNLESVPMNAVLKQELALARASTAKYHNIQTALADGYIDINLYIPNMGWHYMDTTLVDENFEIDKPELLVYAEKPNGGLRLVAVEYAVPLALSSNPPEGFTGDEDVWNENVGAGLWTLHAWVWLHNPDGIFADFNPNVP
jgi:hypothetical protein